MASALALPRKVFGTAWRPLLTGTAVSALKALSRLQSSRAKADMTENLERLQQLHKSGAHDDLEYAKAKDDFDCGADPIFLTFELRNVALGETSSVCQLRLGPSAPPSQSHHACS